MVHAVFRHMRNTKGFVTAFGIAIVGLARAAGAQEVAAVPSPAPTPAPAVASPADTGLDDLSLILETQVTSVSRHAELASEAPASVSVVTAEEIRRHGFRTIAEAIRLVPGIFVHSDRAYEYVGVRGFGLLGDYNTRVLILVDGHAMNSQIAYAQSYLGGDAPLDMSVIERIEVIKGPASATYGPWAFFGVINVVTRKGADVEGALVSGRVDSVFRREGAIVSGRRFEGGLDMVVSLRGLDAPGLTYTFEERGGGAVPGTDYERGKSVYGQLSWKDFSFGLDGMTRVKGLPTAPYAADYGSDTTRYENTQWFAHAGWKHTFRPGIEAQAKVHVNEYAVDDFFPYEETGTLFKDVERESWQGGELHANYSPFAATRVQAGVTSSWHRATGRSFDGVTDVGFEQVFDTQLGYAEVQQRLATNRVRLTAGATVFRHSLFESRVTPRTGVVAKPARGTTVKLLYGEGFRPPALGERYYDDGYTFMANASVRPETVRTLESSVEQVLFGRMRLSVAVHRDWYHDLIHQREVIVDGVTRFQHQNQGDIDAYGTETALHADLGRGWSMRAGHAWSVAESDAGAPLNFPSHLVNGGLRGPIAPQTFLAIDASWVDRRRRELTDEEAASEPNAVRRVPPMFLVNAAVRTEDWGQHIGLVIGVRNLLNRRITDPVVADHKPVVQIDQEPRTLHVAIDYRF